MSYLFFDNPEQLRPLYDTLLQESKTALAEALYPESYADAENTQHGHYNVPGDQLIRFANVLGMRYVLDGDAECADKLKEALLQYAAYDKWIGSECLRKTPPWHSELNTARFLYGMAVGFDCIRDRLTQEERRVLASRCDVLGIQPTMQDWLYPETRVHALDSMGHNWWTVCIAAAGLAAVAFREELPQVEEIIRRVDEGLQAHFDYKGFPLQNKGPNYDAGGAMYEGAGYISYALSELFTYRLARDRAFSGAPFAYDGLIPGALRYILHSAYPTKDDVLVAPIGDCNLHETFVKTFRLATLCGYDLPEVRWYLSRKKGIDDLWGTLAGEKPGQPMTETVAYYPEVGMAMLRDSWETNSRLLCIKCGDTWNHAHADAGSFILFDKGRQMLLDGGSCSYARDEYPLYYCQSEAHNVVLFNGHGQEIGDHYYGVRHPGQVLCCDNGWLRCVQADASGPMARWLRRHFRTFLMLEDALVIIDDLASYEPGEAVALFHHEGSAAIYGQTAEIDCEGEPFRIQAVYPPEARFEHRSGLRDHAPDNVQEYLALIAPLPERTIIQLPQGDPNGLVANRPACVQKIVTVIGSAEACCTEDNDTLVIRVGDTTIALNIKADGRAMHINSNAVLLGWDTDAYLLALHGRDYYMLGGSYLRKKGTVVTSSLGKQNTFGQLPE